MSHWNHRVVRKPYPDGRASLGIHEVFCDDKGLVWATTQEPERVIVEEDDGETVEHLRETLRWMLAACDKPILDYDKIPEEGAQSPEGMTENLEPLFNEDGSLNL